MTVQETLKPTEKTVSAAVEKPVQEAKQQVDQLHNDLITSSSTQPAGGEKPGRKTMPELPKTPEPAKLPLENLNSSPQLRSDAIQPSGGMTPEDGKTGENASKPFELDKTQGENQPGGAKPLDLKQPSGSTEPSKNKPGGDAAKAIEPVKPQGENTPGRQKPMGTGEQPRARGTIDAIKPASTDHVEKKGTGDRQKTTQRAQENANALYADLQKPGSSNLGSGVEQLKGNVGNETARPLDSTYQQVEPPQTGRKIVDSSKPLSRTDQLNEKGSLNDYNTEVQAKKNVSDLHEDLAIKYAKEVKHLEQKITNNEELNDHKKGIWEKLEQSKEGRKLLDKMGGKEAILKQLEMDRGDFLTNIAYQCDQAGLGAQATGRTVHRMAELFTLEKKPDDVLNGIRGAEQRIEFTDAAGNKHSIEIDDLIKRGDKVFIRDYKPIDLSKFEQTIEGQEWARCMEELVGKDFRERIMKGEDPYFHKKVEGLLPKAEHDAFRDYVRSVNESHKQQLEKYTILYSQSTGIPINQVKASVRPYFKFS